MWRRARVREGDPADALRDVRDGLRSRLSVRQALVRAAARPGSPLGPLSRELAGGRPLGPVLRKGARDARDPDVACALAVLGVVGGTGGDAVRILGDAEERIRRRRARAREAEASTAHAKLSARTILLLTPGFLALLVLVDPAGTLSALAHPRGIAALGIGLVLQAAGALWIARLVRSPEGGARPSRLAGIPVVRAAFAIVRGGRGPDVTLRDVALAADGIAILLEAGAAPAKALELAVPGVPGAFGDALRRAVARVRAGEPVAGAVRRATAPLGTDEARRFADAYDAAVGLGVPLADAMRGLAQDAARAWAAELDERVRTASVRVLVPLALLILPAFVLSCLIPLLSVGLEGISP